MGRRSPISFKPGYGPGATGVEAIHHRGDIEMHIGDTVSSPSSWLSFGDDMCVSHGRSNHSIRTLDNECARRRKHLVWGPAGGEPIELSRHDVERSSPLRKDRKWLHDSLRFRILAESLPGWLLTIADKGKVETNLVLNDPTRGFHCVVRCFFHKRSNCL